jgi:hypothetical protein
MTEILKKLIAGATITDRDLADALYVICDDTHASCDSNCPVYEANGNEAPGSDKPFDENRGCDTFKNGMAMLEFLRKKGDEQFLADVDAVTAEMSKKAA